MNKINRILILLICISLAPLSYAQTRATAKLHFHNGVFRIAQFTDLHWATSESGTDTTRNTINAILDKEKPDLAVITGDIVTGKPAVKGWQEVVDIFNKKKQPFCITLGNHDAEYLSKDSIFDILLKSPYFIGSKGSPEVDGVGNNVLPIYGKANKPEALIYLFDSNDYLKNKELGKYDYIHNNQIQWYRAQSDKFTKENGGVPLPALAFFHIPLQEYNLVVTDNSYYGKNNEGEVASSKINSGLFTSLIDKKDVIGVFTGHDHNSDFIGIHFGIALGYGRCTGHQAYGHTERGGRIIELKEGKRRFDTYITTPKGREATYYYPSGLNSNQEKTLPLIKSMNVPEGELTNGVSYKYHEGKAKNIEQMLKTPKVAEGVMPSFSIDSARSKDHFGYEFTTMIKIPKTGVYRFYTFSDDGSKLYIDKHLIVDNDGGHSLRKKDGLIYLEKGYHLVDLYYFEDYMGQGLEVGITSKDINAEPIPQKMLFIRKK